MPTSAIVWPGFTILLLMALGASAVFWSVADAPVSAFTDWVWKTLGRPGESRRGDGLRGILNDSEGRQQF